MKRMHRIASVTFVVVAVLGLTGLTIAQEQEPKTQTITAEVVDTACYMSRGAMGEGHASCAVMCAEVGVPLALLVKESDTLYYPMDAMNNPNDKLKQYAGKTVRVTGKVYEKSKNRTITLDKIEEVKN